MAGIARPERPPKPPARLRRRHRIKELAKFPFDFELERYLKDPAFTVFNWHKPSDVPRLKRECFNPYFDFWEQADGQVGHHFLRQMDHIPPMFADLDKLKRALPWMFRERTTYSDPHVMAASIASRIARSYAVQFFGLAVPNWPALNAIAELDMPIVDLGSGRGYWAWLLERQMRVVCHEILPRRWSWRAPDYTTPHKLPSDHALLFCWPDYGSLWPYRCVARYQGDVVIEVGEGDGGCTAESRFYQLLEQNFRIEKEVAIPQWDGLHDYMSIWRRARRKR